MKLLYVTVSLSQVAAPILSNERRSVYCLIFEISYAVLKTLRT